MRLQGKVVMITGASSGIGALCAQKLSAEGAIPILTARSEKKLIHISQTIQGTHEWMKMDVTDTNGVQTAVEQVIEKYGKIDVVLNNAGYGQFEPLVDMPMSSFEEMMDVNYMGTVRVTKAVLPYMLEAGTGQIVNVASMAGKIGTAKSVSYTASKHAVLGFSNALRQELRKSGIQVTTINPGPIDTPFFEQADPNGNYVKNLRGFIMKPEYVADQIVKAIIGRKEEVNLPRSAAFGMRFYQLFPRFADKLTYRMMNRK